MIEKPSQQQIEQRTNTLLKLHDEPASENLQAYFKRLEVGSPIWGLDTFIEGAKYLANLIGPEREKYYDKPLKGLHYATSFTELWNQAYLQQPITVWDQDIRHQCPPSWSYEFREHRWVLSYQGEAPLSQGLNEFLQGPSTLDCGMYSQFLLWMAMRYIIGDGLFDKTFVFKKKEFILTPTWDEPMTGVGTAGSLLYPFYDDPRYVTTKRSRIQTRTVFNYPTYLAKHPGGAGRLHNVTEIDGYNIIFDPGAPQNILSTIALDERFMQVYNAPRSSTDLEKVWLYTNFPEIVHPDFAPKSWGDLAEEIKRYADHTLDETKWKASRVEREGEAHGLHLIFNFQRLVRCLEETNDEHQSGTTSVFSRARKMKYDDYLLGVRSHLSSLERRLQTDA